MDFLQLYLSLAPSKKDTQINQPPDDDVEEMELSEPVDKSGYFTCDANLATNIHDVITADLLPQLYATMTVILRREANFLTTQYIFFKCPRYIFLSEKIYFR